MSGTHADDFLRVIESHKGIIYKVANSYCRDDENRKDLIQEIILQLWLSFNKYNDQFKLTTWIYRIALNVSISFFRKEHRRTPISQPLPDGVLNLNENPAPEQNIAEIEKLYFFIRELKEIDRAIIILYLEENSHQEMAEILGLTQTNIATRISRIKQQLKLKFSLYKP
ncbi:MAG: sigma-70 family RNA polymerase sigma factor [Saprospiraceae bacterium]|nr:sigma-70 family RNA polymerase sigma factor [Saprospiraceae bacterium]